MSNLFHKLELKLELTVAHLLVSACIVFFFPFPLSTDLYPNSKYMCDRGEEEEEEEEEEEKERMWSLTKGREGDSFSCIQMMLKPTLLTLLSSHLLLLLLLLALPFPCYFYEKATMQYVPYPSPSTSFSIPIYLIFLLRL